MAMTLYTSPLSPEQAAKLRVLLENDHFQFEPKPYTLYYATKERLNVAVYQKGPKIVLQGKGTEDFVQFRLEQFPLLVRQGGRVICPAWFHGATKAIQPSLSR